MNFATYFLEASGRVWEGLGFTKNIQETNRKQTENDGKQTEIYGFV
jgi:hypothetical protein